MGTHYYNYSSFDKSKCLRDVECEKVIQRESITIRPLFGRVSIVFRPERSYFWEHYSYRVKL